MLELVPLSLLGQESLFELGLGDASFRYEARARLGFTLTEQHVTVLYLGVVTRDLGLLEGLRRR